MRYLKLYLETSVWNFYYADDSPEKKEATHNFFDSLPNNKFDIYISDIVMAEFEQATETKKDQLIKLIDNYNPTILTVESSVRELADAYLANNVLPQKSAFDAYHIAFASVNELDFIVSWNLKHIANIQRQEKVQAINILNGYTKSIQMITPMEVSEHE